MWNENRYRQLVELLAEPPAGRLLDVPAGEGPSLVPAVPFGKGLIVMAEKEAQP